MRRFATLGALAFGVVWTVLVAGPTFSQTPDGTVTATVNVNIGPCISVAPTSFVYAPAGFSSSQPVTTTPSGTKPIVTNCSNQAENILARGSAATGPGGAAWELQGGVLQCSSGPDKYRHEIHQLGGSTMPLTLVNQTWEGSVPATGSDTRVLDGILTMPCTGSTGGGQTMSMSIFLTAVVVP
jgi:hypothetical protein